MIIIPFNAAFTKLLPNGNPNPEFDPYIKYKLIEQDSMEYLVNLGIEGLKRILENNSFTSSKQVQEQLDEYKEENNPIIGFIKDQGIELIENQPTNEVYKRYQVFCADNAMTPMSNVSFSKQINRELGLYVNVVKLDGKTRRIFIRGQQI